MIVSKWEETRCKRTAKELRATCCIFIGRFLRKTVVVMQRWKLKNLGTAELLTSPTCFSVIRTPLQRGGQISNDCQQTLPKGESEKKGGRKKASEADPELIPRLEEAVANHVAGSPVTPDVQWTHRTPTELADELNQAGHPIFRTTVKSLLRNVLNLGCRKISKSQTMGNSEHRNEQFEAMFSYRDQFLENGWPVLSIDTKKKELLGKFYRNGTAWTDGKPRAWDHDFPSSSWGKVIPYGVYDLARNEALMYLAQGTDTGRLAVDAIRRWWYRMGKWRYDSDSPLLLLADCGGSNGYRVKLFHDQLQQLSNLLHRTIRVSHIPPYCSKYNPIDHRVFCHVGRSLQSLILTSVEVIRDAISKTTTRTGLSVVVELARKVYPAKEKATDQYLRQESIIRDEKLKQFNYKFEPQTPKLFFT